MSDITDLVTYLRLAPEFGGARFGPFEGLEVRLGSNNERCHIVLAEALGVLPEHAKLLRQRDNSLILTPAERTATIFLWKPGERRPTQVYTPTAVRPGDAFSLVTADGPRFIIELDELPPEIKEKREQERKVRTGRRRLSAATMAAEAKRQAWTNILVLGPAQMASRAWVFIKSGAIYQPRNIFLAAAIIGGYVFGGFAFCGRKKYQTTITRLENEGASCKQQNEILQSLSAGGGESLFHELALQITNSPLLGTALESDSELRGQVERWTKILFTDSKSWDWLITAKGPKASEFARWREELFKEDDIDIESARLLVWLAAMTGPNSDFVDVENISGEKVCGRGLLKMTHRQARNMGMDAQPDSYLEGNYQPIVEDTTQREARLLATLQLFDPAGLLPEGTIETSLDPIREGRSGCLYMTGDDDRTRRSDVIRALAKVAGKGRPQLPDDTIQWATTARVARYWSSEMPNNDLTGKDGKIDFTKTFTGTVLSNTGSEGKWVMDQTARTIAKAIVLPCFTVLKGRKEDAEKMLGAENVPSAVSCLVLDWKLRNEG